MNNSAIKVNDSQLYENIAAAQEKFNTERANPRKDMASLAWRLSQRFQNR